jgi:hypothetical protein
MVESAPETRPPRVPREYVKDDTRPDVDRAAVGGQRRQQTGPGPALSERRKSYGTAAIRIIGWLATALGAAVEFVTGAPWRLLALVIRAIRKLLAPIVRLGATRRRAVLLLLLCALFAYFVWPTPYTYYAVGGRLVRVNRVTGAAQYVPVGWPQR